MVLDVVVEQAPQRRDLIRPHIEASHSGNLLPVPLMQALVADGSYEGQQLLEGSDFGLAFLCHPGRGLHGRVPTECLHNCASASISLKVNRLCCMPTNGDTWHSCVSSATLKGASMAGSPLNACTICVSVSISLKVYRLSCIPTDSVTWHTYVPSQMAVWHAVTVPACGPISLPDESGRLYSKSGQRTSLPLLTLPEGVSKGSVR